MSATLVSSNTTIKVNAAVNASRSSLGTVYTAPANGYAIVQVYDNLNGNINMPGAALLNQLNGQAGLTQFYLGPGQYIEISSYTAGTVYVYGVEFVNTP
jgi:hypothetical protein